MGSGDRAIGGDAGLDSEYESEVGSAMGMGSKGEGGKGGSEMGGSEMGGSRKSGGFSKKDSAGTFFPATCPDRCHPLTCAAPTIAACFT